MASVTMLKRVESVSEAVPDNLAALDQDLAKQAKDRLGYDPMASEQNSLRYKRELYSFLLDLGIKPFSEATVERYKARVLLHYWLATFAIAAGFAALGVGSVWLGVVYERWWTITGAVLGGLVGLGGVIGAFGIREPANWDWHLNPLSRVNTPVPAHALALALQVQDGLSKRASGQKLYDAVLCVDQFSKAQRVYDPFLVLRYGGENAYIAVWDEPKFDAKLLA